MKEAVQKEVARQYPSPSGDELKYKRQEFMEMLIEYPSPYGDELK